MCKLKICVPTVLLLSSFVSNSAYAALVEIIASGNTDNTSGSITYTPDSSFTVRAVFDTNIAKNSFFVTPTGQSALVSFELTTEMGTITYLEANRTVVLPPLTIQRQDLNSQNIFVTYLESNTFPVPGDGFNSTMSNLVPGSFGFSLNANIFTNDIDKLFSGIDALPNNGNILGGVVFVRGVDGNGVPAFTELSFGEFSQYSINTVSAVPIPAAAWLFVSGLIGLIGIAKRKS